MDVCCSTEAVGGVFHHLKKMTAQNRKSHLHDRKSQLFEIIHYACKNADIDLLQLLLEPFDDSEQYRYLCKQGRNGDYPLHAVLSSSDTRSEDRLLMVQYILKLVPEQERLRYLRLRRSYEGQTVLHMAAILNEYEVADKLVSLLDLNQRKILTKLVDNKRKSVLDYPLTDEFKGVLEKPETATSETKSTSRTSLGQSLSHTYKNPFQRSSTSPCIPVSRRNISLSCIDSILEMASIDSVVDIKFLTDQYIDDQGKTLLHLAAEQNNVVAVKKLLRFCHPLEKRWQLISKQCHAGMTALHYACMKNNHEIIVDLLYHSQHHDEKLIDMKDKKKRNAQRIADKASKELFSLVRTHYWRTFIKPPTALVFYNRYSGDPDWERIGADKECNDILESINQLGINPLSFSDFSSRELMDTIKTHAMFDTMSALIVFIMSHGSDGFIYDINKQSVPIQDVLKAMCTDEDRSLPKVLLLQCCLCNSFTTEVAADPAPSPCNLSSRFHLHERNMCLLSSTLDNTPSRRGYCFSLLKELLLNEPNLDLVTIFERLNKSMEEQVPLLHTSLTRKLVLSPIAPIKILGIS